MEETKKCKHCQSDIDKKAKVCPNCRKKQGGKLKFIIIGIVAVFILSALFGGGDDGKPKLVDETKPTNAEIKEVKEEKVEETDNEFKVGDVIETDTLKISYLSADDYVTDNEFITPKDGNKYIKVGFEFENLSDGDQVVSSWDFECYADGYSVDESYIGDDNLDATLSKGKKAKGSIYFEVPEDTKEVSLEYETNFFTEDKIIFIVK